jgi:hypothetical protein
MIAANNHYAGFGPRTTYLERWLVFRNYPGKFNYDSNNKRRKEENSMLAIQNSFPETNQK